MYDPDSGCFELENDKPLVLLLGSIAHEGVLSMLQASDRQYKQKILHSKPKNWQSIVDYFNDFEVVSVLIKLDPHTISLMASEDYQNISKALFGKISVKQNIVFIYEDLLSGKVEIDEWSKFKNKLTEEDLNKVLNMLQSFNLELVPYKRNAQVTVLAESFLQDTEKNLLFRLYVPSSRMWSNETDRLLQLFRDYLSTIGHLSVRLDQQRTDKGIIYEFHGDEPKGEHGLSEDFSEFTRFLDLCVSDQAAAGVLLENKHIDNINVQEILTRYSKEAKRLHVDLKHERERKILSIHQRLESELIDYVPNDVDWAMVKQIVETTVPTLEESGSPLRIINSLSRTNSPKAFNVTINVKPQIVETVNGIVAQEINGNQNLGVQGQQLLELVQQYGEERRDELASAVYEINDKGTPVSEQLKASQKLKKFLIEVGRKTGDVAAGVLQKYIEHKLGL